MAQHYGVEVELPDGSVRAPLSYKDYLRLLLKRTTWGEDVVAHALVLEHKVFY